MNRNITERLTRLSVRLEELNQLLSSESVTANLDNYRKLTREHSEIVPVSATYKPHGKCMPIWKCVLLPKLKYKLARKSL